MIVSFHPCFEADVNRLCAGRAPDELDKEAILAAEAVILPQGCSKALYEMARSHCRRVFPNYDVRFRRPGKIGQTRLFSEFGAAHPKTKCFASAGVFFSRHPDWKKTPPLPYPFVFKFDWGGEGETVFRAEDPEQLEELVFRALEYESTGQRGFLVQETIPAGGRSLRVCIIGQTAVSYWRRAEKSDAFLASLSSGGKMDGASDPDLQSAGRKAALQFSRQCGIDLAGIDILFSEASPAPAPLFLEINYFFGRKGLGGSDRFYRILVGEIRRWLSEQVFSSSCGRPE